MKKLTSIKALNKYCSDVTSGRIACGINERNAVKRFISDMTGRKKWDFREYAVLKVVDFVAQLKHFEGVHAGSPFLLEPWQLFIIANLYGFYGSDGFRRFQTAYIEVARKNGKTALVAAISLYSLLADNEESAQILLAANSKDQAKIAFNIVKSFTRGYDPKERTLKAYRADIVLQKAYKSISELTDRQLSLNIDEYAINDLVPSRELRDSSAFIKTLAADSSKIDGYNCHVGIIDEYHEAPNSRVRDVIRSSQGMRQNPLLITITTAGFDKSKPCYELSITTSEIISGVKKDDSFFGMIFSIDDGDDWKDPKVWRKANPNLGITVNKKFLETQVQQAVNSPADEVGVKTKNLNVWCDTATTWIPNEYIIKASNRLRLKDFAGMDCYVGVDLASNVDLTAVSYLFVKDEKYYFITDYYIPRETLENRNLHADRELYNQWVANKYLKVTAGNVTDYDYITRDILAVNEIAPVNVIFYDKYNSTSWAIQCTEQGLPMEPFSQTIGNFNNPTKQFERLILGGMMVLDDNPVTRYCLRNVELRYDFNGNCKPNKLNEKKKIDGVISMLQATAAYQKIEANYQGTNIF